MKRKQYGFMLALALVAGLIGGFVSSHVIQPVFARKESEPQKVVIAQEFRLVDKKGRILAELKESAFFPWDEKSQKLGPPEYKGTPVLAMYGKQRRCDLSDDGLRISDSAPPSLLIASADEFSIRGEGMVSMSCFPPGPNISLVENGRIPCVLGSQELETRKTGAVITRSAASLVLFDKAGNVVWSTPK